MARVTREQASRISPKSNNWFKLVDDGDTALVQFPYTSPEEVAAYSVHKLKDGNDENDWGYKVDCLRDPDESIDKCPLCSQAYAVTAVHILEFYNITTQRYEFWERSSKVADRIIALMNTYGAEEFPYMVFQIQRIGAKRSMDTKYEFMLMPREDPVDWNSVDRIDPIGVAIRAKSADEMDEFLETGQWPEVSDAGSGAPSARTASNPARRQPPSSSPAARKQQPKQNNPAPAAPPAASSRRAPRAQSSPNGGQRTSRSRSGGSEEQF